METITLLTLALILSVLCASVVIVMTGTWKFLMIRMTLAATCSLIFVTTFFFFGDKYAFAFTLRMIGCFAISSILLMRFPVVSIEGKERWMNRMNFIASLAASHYLISTMRWDFKLTPGDHMWLRHVAYLIWPIVIVLLARFIFSRSNGEQLQ